MARGTYGTFALFGESFLICLVPLPRPANCPLHYNSTVSGSVHRGFKHRLCPVHSPLLWASLLFSFPALNDMLKFSAYSHTAEVVYKVRSFVKKKEPPTHRLEPQEQ